MKRQIAPVTLSNYKPEWPEMYKKEAAKIAEATGKYFEAIEHIGSTSIPNCISKPEIDIMIGVKRLTDADKCIEPIEELGYQYFERFEEFEPRRRYLRKSKGIVPIVHIHIVETSSIFWKERLLFRDYLRSHSDIVEEYSNLKKELVSLHNNDRIGYGDDKDKFIQKIIDFIKNKS